MMMLWGEKDPGSLVSQALELFRGLRHYGVPSKLVVFPREGHVLSETNHLRQHYELILEWFDKYLKTIPSK
jgi:dipeptidyl aminopeptidase/acylaminoacyl peptidase